MDLFVAKYQVFFWERTIPVGSDCFVLKGLQSKKCGREICSDRIQMVHCMFKAHLVRYIKSFALTSNHHGSLKKKLKNNPVISPK